MIRRLFKSDHTRLVDLSGTRASVKPIQQSDERVLWQALTIQRMMELLS